MADFELSLHAGSLAEWSDERVSQAWRIISGLVRRLSSEVADEPVARERLLAAESDAAMFGDELIRRGRL